MHGNKSLNADGETKESAGDLSGLVVGHEARAETSAHQVQSAILAEAAKAPRR